MQTRTAAIAAAGVTGLFLVGSLLAIQLAPGRGTEDCRNGVIAGEATIGGPFELVSETGETVTDTQIIDRPTLVYFGYTFCPDVCPLDAARNAEALDLLKDRGHRARALFISVDPKRDTPEVLAEYTDYMHPDMIGLTGSPEQVASAASAYRVVYRAHEADDEFYLVDHTAFTYLVMPGTGFVEFFRRDLPAEAMAEQVACFIDSAE